MYTSSKIYKGVSGAYSLNDKAFNLMNNDKKAFNFHLYNYLTIYRQKIDYSKLNNQQIFSLSNKLLQSSPLWDMPGFRSFGLSLEKPFSYSFPLNQNFVAHTYMRRNFDLKHLQLSKNIPIDFSEYYETGISIQNMLEIETFINAINPFYKFFSKNYSKDNIQIKAINHVLHSTSEKSYQYSKTQPNNDFEAKISYIESGVEKQFLCDSKIIQYPEKNLPLLNGNVSIAYQYNEKLYLDRLFGSLSVMRDKVNYNDIEIIDPWIKELRQIINKIKKELPKNDIGQLKSLYLEASQLSFKITCNPNIKDIFPSTIVEANIQNDDHDNDYLLELKESMDNIVTHPQAYFPPMGKETLDYPILIESFIKKLPKTLRDEHLENYNLLMDFVIKNTIMP